MSERRTSSHFLYQCLYKEIIPVRIKKKQELQRMYHYNNIKIDEDVYLLQIFHDFFNEIGYYSIDTVICMQRRYHRRKTKTEEF